MKSIIDTLCMIIATPFAIVAALIIGALMFVMLTPFLIMLCLCILLAGLLAVAGVMITIIYWVVTGKDLL